MHYLEQQNHLNVFRKRSLPSKRPVPERKYSEVDMMADVVDMDAFSQILALDEAETSEGRLIFSRSLTAAWCDQAQDTLEEMYASLGRGEIASLASQAHFLKGSSASLGLLKVSQSCLALYHVHFPTGLSHMRGYSYPSTYSSIPSSASFARSVASLSSSSSSSSNSPSPSCLSSSTSSSGYMSPFNSPISENGAIDFEIIKLDRARLILDHLSIEIKEASTWLVRYYTESDKYAARRQILHRI